MAMDLAEAVDSEPVQLLDDETWLVGLEAFRRAYQAAADLVAPRIAARHGTLTAAANDEQLITDDEWEEIITEHISDEMGDATLDGLMAGVLTFGVLGVLGLRVGHAASELLGLIDYAPSIRLRLDQWIAAREQSGLAWDAASVREGLTTDGPFTDAIADQVARTELQGAANGGLFEGMQDAQPAALRWITQRDIRVRFEHAAADQETVPFGSTFTVGGYQARYPGDPLLPFELRVNCRCELGYVEGSEARRVIGATKAELTAKAQTLSIDGRSTMNRGELQAAVLRALCLQGLAGGPDCPDRFDQMNRSTLLAYARGEGIVGRHSMTRGQLIQQLRATMRGSDTVLTAQGYSPRAVFGAAQKRARYKRGRAGRVELSGSTRAPSVTARNRARSDLYAEFGGNDRGFVPCVHCGLKLTDDPTAGMAMIVPEPIVPWSAGGSLAAGNLLPSCTSCFRAASGLVAAAGWVDGQTVSARAYGWDMIGGGDFALTRDDLPRLTTLVGPLTVNYVDDLDYTQYVVNGIPVDSDTIQPISLPGEVLIASTVSVCARCGLPEVPSEFAAGIAAVPRDQTGKWCKGAQCNEGQMLETMDAAEFAKKSPQARVSAPAEWFASEAELAETQALSNQKARDVPQPSAEKIAHNKEQAQKAKEGKGRAGGDNRGSAATRRARGEALFDEYGGNKRGYVPCTHCGIKTSPKGRGGHASMEQDKILTLNEGGSYGGIKSFPNLIPSCSGCNKHRGEKPYPVRPSWEAAGLSVIRVRFAALTEAEATDRIDDEVVAFPLGWDDPDLDVFDQPVQGLLATRRVSPFFGAYDQWIVGGEVVDPDHIYDLDDPLVASASMMCPDCGGWIEAVTASAAAVPRDPTGKWCKGAQCNGQLEMDMSPMTPGQKAAATKKKNAAMAAAAKQAAYDAEQEKLAKAAELEEMKQFHISSKIDGGRTLDKPDVDGASDATVDAYLAKNAPKLTPSTPDERRDAMRAMNDQHIADRKVLNEQLGYNDGHAAGPRESRRAVLRETGERRPTGGPNPTGARVMFTDDQIDAMSDEKRAALIAHHSGKSVDQVKASHTPEERASLAKFHEADYQANVSALKASGYQDEQIPRSHLATAKMQNGVASGFPAKPTAVPVVAAPGAVGKPANWSSMSPGQKAAWTKKNNPKQPNKFETPKPPEWDSWTSGQKAAYTKGQNLKGAKTSGPAGAHEVHTYTGGAARESFMNSVKAAGPLKGEDVGKGHHSQRQSAQSAKLTTDQRYAIDSYGGSGYGPMNGTMKRGESHGPAVTKKVADMKSAYKGPAATPAPRQMYRGKGSGSGSTMQELDLKVGDVYVDKGFGSWSVDLNIAESFSDHGNRRVIVKLTDSRRVPSLVSYTHESETIMPANSKYRVTMISDHITPGDSYGNQGRHYRYMEVELVD